jgi:hypothetical protein
MYVRSASFILVNPFVCTYRFSEQANSCIVFTSLDRDGLTEKLPGAEDGTDEKLNASGG